VAFKKGRFYLKKLNKKLYVFFIEFLGKVWKTPFSKGVFQG
jgi:hypothetical protein